MATIEGYDLHSGSLRDLLPTSLVFETESNTRLRIGHDNWDQTTPSLKLLHIRAFLVAIADLHVDASLKFEFSGITVAPSDAKPLLDRWDETGEPPVMSLIAFRMCEDAARHGTCGLSAFMAIIYLT